MRYCPPPWNCDCTNERDCAGADVLDEENDIARGEDIDGLRPCAEAVVGAIAQAATTAARAIQYLL